MSIGQLAKLWTALSVFVLYYAVNSWLVSQGGKPILDANLIVEDRVPAAVAGIFICSTMLAVAATIGWIYAKRVERSAGMADGPSWAGRVPVVFFDELDLSDTIAQAYQGIMLVLTILVPCISLVHFWNRMLGASIYTTGNSPIKVDTWDFGVTLAQWNDPARICSAYDVQDGCVGGGTFLPGVEPLFLAVVCIVALLACVRQLFAVFR